MYIYIVLISIIFAGMAFDSANVLITYRIIYVAWKRWLSFKNIEIAVILLILISLLVNIVGSIQVINTISYIDILSILISLLAMYMAFKKYNILIMPATIEILEKKIEDEYLIKHLFSNTSNSLQKIEIYVYIVSGTIYKIKGKIRLVEPKEKEKIVYSRNTAYLNPESLATPYLVIDKAIIEKFDKNKTKLVLEYIVRREDKILKLIHKKLSLKEFTEETNTPMATSRYHYS